MTDAASGRNVTPPFQPPRNGRRPAATPAASGWLGRISATPRDLARERREVAVFRFQVAHPLAIRRLRAAGVRGVSFDLICGLPRQIVQSCVETAERCVALRPDRFAEFGYAHLPSFKNHQRKIDEAAAAR